MKVICKEDCELIGVEKHFYVKNLTPGKMYEISTISENYFTNGFVILYEIINDLGEMICYHSELFMKLDEYRDKKIDDIIK